MVAHAFIFFKFHFTFLLEFSPSLLLLPFPTPPVHFPIYSPPQWVKTPMGSQQGLTHHLEAEPRSSLLYVH